MIADFVMDRMSSYIAGGMSAGSAAHFTRGELEAIYKGRHYNRDNVGEWRVTTAPERIGLAAAMFKADAIITGIVKTHERANKNASGTAGASARKTGLEGLKTLWEKTA